MIPLSQAVKLYMDYCYTLTERTRFIYRQHLERLVRQLEDPPLETITSHQLIQFMAGMKKQNGKPYSPGFMDQIWRTLHTFFEYCAREWLPGNPMKNVPRPKLVTGPKPRLSIEQIDQLLGQVRQTEQAERNTTIILLMVDSGLRISEVANLRICDIDLEEQSAYILPQKTRQAREVPLSDMTIKALEAYFKQRSPADRAGESLFLTAKGPRKGQPLTKKAIGELMKRLKKRLGGPLHAHLLRHTFGNHYIRRGGLKQLQKIMGHSRIDTTARFYVDPDFADIQREHKTAAPTAQMRDQ